MRGYPLSVEFSNWACNQVIRNERDDRGQFFHDLLRGFKRYGICREAEMPYAQKFYPEYEPSERALKTAKANKRLRLKEHWIKPYDKTVGITDEHLAEIKKTLARGWPVCGGSSVLDRTVTVSWQSRVSCFARRLGYVRRLRLICAVLLSLGAAALPAWAEEEDQAAGILIGGSAGETSNALVEVGGGLDVYLEHGVDIKGVRAPFTLHLGGLLQFDYIGYGDASQALEDAAGEPWHSDWDIRRARIRFEGTVLRALHYRVRVNIDPLGDTGFQDLFLDWSRFYDDSDGAWPRIRLGQVKEPFGLEFLTSTKWITFMETAPPTQAFAPGRSAGVRLQGAPFKQRTTWWLGVFAPNVTSLTDVDRGSGVAVSGRLTWLALADPENPRRILSLGAGATLRYDVEAERFFSNTGGNVGRPMIDTGTFAADWTRIFQTELTFIHDRFSAQAEAFFGTTAPTSGVDESYYGFYGQLSYFLTPPGREFNRPAALVTRVKPTRPIYGGEQGGWGAWEVAARYSFTDLSGEVIGGGTAQQVTVGLSWHPTQWQRVMLNYTVDIVNDAYGDRSADGTIHLLGIRFQADF